MALEIQIGTTKAVANLAALESSVLKLEARMKGFNASGLTRASAAIKGMKPIPPGVAASFGKVSNAANKTAAASNRAGKAVNGLKGKFSGLRSTLGLVASGLATIGISQFVKGSFEMNNTMDRASAVFNDLAKNAKGGGVALEFVKKVAKDTATPIKAAIDSYTRLSQTAVKMGKSQEDVNKTFKDVAIAFRAVGAGSDETARGMKAVTQVFSKGKAGAEELRQQMGEIVAIIPAIARALGKTPAEIDKAMSEGKLSVEDFRLGLDRLAKESGPLVENMLKKAGAQATQMSNEMKLAEAAFGAAVFPALIPVMKAIGDVFRGVSGEVGKTANAAEMFGQALGVIGGAIGRNMDLVLALGAAFAAYKFVQWGAAALEFGRKLLSLAGPLAGIAGKAALFVSRVPALVSGLFASATAAGAAAGALRSFGAVLATAAGFLGVFVAAFAVATALYAAYMVATGQSEELTRQFGAALDWIAGLFGTTGAEVIKSAKAFLTWGRDLLSNNAIVRGAISLYDSFMSSMSSLGGEIQRIAGIIAGTFSSAWSTAGSIVTGVASTIISAVRAIIGAVNSAINALRRLAGAQASSGGGSGPNARLGGVVGPGGGFSGAMGGTGGHDFTGAPHFADGGVTGSAGGSGIPAILHPNEAVIPLKGGAVPVSISGGQRANVGGGGGGDAGRALIRFIKAGNLNTSRILDRIQQQTAFQTDHFRKAQTQALRMNVTLDKLHVMLRFDIKFMTDSIVAAIGNIQTSAPASTGGFSAGAPIGSAFDNFGLQPEPQVDLAAARTQLDKLIRDRSKSGGSVGVLSPEFNFNGGRTRAPGDVEKAVAQTNARNQAAIDRENEIGDLQQILGLQRDILQVRKTNVTADDFKPRYNINIMPFAKGTPNTSKESGLRQTGSGGGMLAQLHPNEAVIPLPDGRSVPVTLQSGGDGGGGTGSAPNISVNITMNVDAKDAGSFARSKPQMMQDLTLEIRNAMRSVGEPESSDLSRTSQRVVKKG